MAEVKKIGRVTFRKLTDEEALAEYGSSFVFVGQPVNAGHTQAVGQQTINAKCQDVTPKLCPLLRELRPLTENREGFFGSSFFRP
jgi:hypothetical protein